MVARQMKTNGSFTYEPIFARIRARTRNGEGGTSGRVENCRALNDRGSARSGPIASEVLGGNFSSASVTIHISCNALQLNPGRRSILKVHLCAF